jgi:translation initiation factor 3 subunit C
MSRFWAAAESSSGSESSDDSSAVSSIADDKKVGNRWVDFSDDSESEDEVRVVKSAKTRTFEALETFISAIRNAMKIRDYASIQSNFDDLMKTVSSTKTQSIIDAHGGVPRFFVKILCDLEVYLAERKKDKAAVKKLSATQTRALNRMGMSLKKQSKVYEKLMEEYRANPGVADEEEDDEKDDVQKSDSDSDSDSGSESDSESDDSSPSPATKKKPMIVSSDSDESSDSDSSDSSSSSSSDSDSDSDSDASSSSDDSDDWASSSSSSSSSDSDAEGGAYSQLKGRARWLKKNTVVKEKVVKDKEGRGKARAEAKAAAAAARAAEALAAEEAKEADVSEETMTVAVLERKCKEIISSRGRRGTDNKIVLKKLEALAKVATRFGPRVEVPMLMHVITAQFDLIRSLDDCMDTQTWKSCATYLNKVASILEDGDTKYRLDLPLPDENDLMIGNMIGSTENKMKDAAGARGDIGAVDMVAAEKKSINPHTGEIETDDERAERLRLEKEAKMTTDELCTIRVYGSLSLFLNRLDEEYFKSLQRTSPHSAQYVIRLRDEVKLVELLNKVYKYFQRIDSKAEAAELALLHIEHIYYRHDSIASKIDRISKLYDLNGEPSGLDINSIPEVNTDFRQLVNDLCTYVYQHGTDRSKTRAMMCHIFHHALHDRFLEARDLLLMSHLQDNISNVGDVSTMILFNRMMVTLGLSAFRLGRIWDAHQCLSDICSGRSRELLAQGVSTGRFAGEKSLEQEKAEKRRQVPYHQHINLDLLEACHLISAMLLEVPNMAAGEIDGSTRKTKIISRAFRKNHDIYDRQVFTGPPEQTRDFVMRATKALMKGDWKKCADLLTNLDVWQLVPGDNAIEQIQTMLVEKIKLEGLRTYLFAFSAQYDSLSLGQLCGMFDMTKNEVHSTVSKMMINGELHASWDQPTETIVLKKLDPTPLQLLALQYAEKAASLVESNERLLDVKAGNYGHRDSEGVWKSGGDHQRNSYQQSQRRVGGQGGSAGAKGSSMGRGGRQRAGAQSGRGGGRGGGYKGSKVRSW